MTATSLTAQPISIAHTRNTVHQEQSIVKSLDINPTAQVDSLLPPIAMNTNGTLCTIPDKTQYQSTMPLICRRVTS